MSWTPQTRTLTILLLSIAAAGAVWAVDAPLGVSPGSLDRVATMRDGCTTYSWQEVEGASGYELVAYELAEDAAVDTGLDPEQVREVLFVRLPGGVTSWTPEVSDCLAPGGRYAWFVRAVLDEETGEATEWSAPLLFTIPATPSLVEVEKALEVLLRYVEDGAETEGRARGGPERREIADLAGSAAAKVASRSVQTGTAAIRGEQPDPAGDTYGVVGTSASPYGAGLGAANTAGGPDLVLDGSADLEPDADLSQSGIDRPWATAQTFNIGNSAGNGMTLQVDGVEVVTTATDQDTVGALSCAPNEIAKFIGGVWTCAPDVDTNTDTLAGLMCASGQVVEWDGAAWVCAPDDDTLAALGCASHEIAKWSGVAWVCASDKDTIFIPGPGLFVDDGEIRIDPLAFSTRITTVESGLNMGRNISLAIGVDDRGLVAYTEDIAANGVRVAHCEDASCSQSVISALDATGYVMDPSVAIGVDGLGLVSYEMVTSDVLKVAHCDTVRCTSAAVSTIDATGDIGGYTSTAVGADGLGLISYLGGAGINLRVAHCDDVVCSSATITTLDGNPSTGFMTSVAIGADGLGLIGYFDSMTKDLRVAHCNDLACTSAVLTTLDSVDDVGTNPSVAIGADGLGLIAYEYKDATDFDLKIAHCDDAACTSATISVIDSDGGDYPSVVIGADGLGLISYWGSANHDLKVAKCRDMACTSAELIVVDDAGSVGSHSSVAIGADGRALITYEGSSNDSIKVAHLPYGY